MAQKGVNKVILIGHLGQDPEVRYMPNGNAVANITLATSETWKDKNSGQQQERTEWHRVVFFGKLAEIAGEYLRKGSQVYIEGRLQTRKWQDQNGQDRYTTEVVVDIGGTMQMLGSRQNNGGGQQGGGQGGYQQQQGGGAPQGYQQQGAPQGYQQQGNQQAGQHQGNGAPPPMNQGNGPAPGAAPNQGAQGQHGTTAHSQAGQGAQYSQPTMDFDDDIPF